MWIPWVPDSWQNGGIRRRLESTSEPSWHRDLPDDAITSLFGKRTFRSPGSARLRSATLRARQPHFGVLTKIMAFGGTRTVQTPKAAHNVLSLLRIIPYPSRIPQNPWPSIVILHVADLRFCIFLDPLGRLWGNSQAENAGSIPVARSQQSPGQRLYLCCYPRWVSFRRATNVPQ